MKKIGKKLSYFTKLFLAFSLLFNSVSSFAVVLAETIPEEGTGNVATTDNGEVSDKEDATDVTNTGGSGEEGTVLENENKETGETTEGEGNNEVTGPVTGTEGTGETEGSEGTTEGTVGEGTDTVEPTTVETEPTTGTETIEPTGEGTETTEPTTGGETVEPVQELSKEVGITVGDDGIVLITYADASKLEEGSKLVIKDKMTYQDGSVNSSSDIVIDITDEVKTALEGTGYEYEAILISKGQSSGEYEITATIGEATNTVNKAIEKVMGYTFSLTNNGEEIVKSNGVYNVDKNAEKVDIILKLNSGEVNPEITYTIGDSNYSAEELINGVVVKTVELKGYLHGEIINPVNVIVTGEDNNKEYYNEFVIMYGSYQDNTDALNESAFDLNLEGKYAFYGDSEVGNLYVSGELDKEELGKIIEGFIGESDKINYEITDENGKYIVNIDDVHYVIINYSTPEYDEEGKIKAYLELEEDKVTSGDKFTVNYIVKLKDYMINGISGLLEFDEDMFLAPAVIASGVMGGMLDNTFMYTAIDDAMGGKVTTDEEGNEVVEEQEYVLLSLTFKALKAGTGKISVKDGVFYYNGTYYSSEDEITLDVNVEASSDNSLASLSVAGQDIELQDGVYEYEITVGSDITLASVIAAVANDSATYTTNNPELVEGENTITVTVTAADGSEQVYTIKVTKEASSNEEETTEETTQPVSYVENNYSNSNNNSNSNNDDNKQELKPTEDDNKAAEDDKAVKKDDKGTLSRVIIIILILLVIAGLIYLIFKDDKDDEETKRVNKEVDRLKKEDVDSDSRKNYNNQNRKNNNKKGR